MGTVPHPSFIFTGMDKTRLHGILPESVYNQLLTIPEIDGPKRMSHFVGQCAHESANWKATVENLNYSGEALYKLFKSHFKNQEEANTYARQPEKIANRIYANRMGNGSEASGDGWKYRGRGYLQTTGKSNYKALGDHLQVDLLSTPDFVATTYPLLSAAFFFTTHNLWAICDQGVDDATILKVTKVINGGDNGLVDRIAQTKKIYNILTA